MEVQYSLQSIYIYINIYTCIYMYINMHIYNHFAYIQAFGTKNSDESNSERPYFKNKNRNIYIHTCISIFMLSEHYRL